MICTSFYPTLGFPKNKRSWGVEDKEEVNPPSGGFFHWGDFLGGREKYYFFAHWGIHWGILKIPPGKIINFLPFTRGDFFFFEGAGKCPLGGDFEK